MRSSRGVVIGLALLVALLAPMVVTPGSALADPVNARPEPADALTIMSFNIASAHWCQQANGCLYDDPDYMLDVVADLIVENGVDLAGLQEVEILSPRHASADMVADLQSKLDDRGYPMYAWFEARNPAAVGVAPGEFGIAMLSRVPATIYSSQLYNSSIHASAAPVQQAVFNFDGTLVRVFNLHAYVQGSCDVITPGVVNPVQSLLDEFTVLIGDFNDYLTTPCMTDLMQTHLSVCVESGDPTCAVGVDQVMHPNNTSNVDHVLYRFAAGADTEFLDGWVDPSINDNATVHPGPGWVSDHYPIFGRFDLDPGPVAASGDVSCDDRTTLLDALMINQFVVGARDGSDDCAVGDDPGRPVHLAAADVSGDAQIDSNDVMAILTCLVGRCN